MASSDAPIEICQVALRVRDLDKVAGFYRDVIGLTPLSAEGGVRRLGVDDHALVELREEKAALRRRPGGAGLYHTAFLLPSHQALADWFRHVVRTETPLQGASDHSVSEAIYLADPEGNGIEVYADRPREAWRYSADGVVMTTEHLDLDALLGEAGNVWRGVPEGSVVGHVHLQVGALPEAENFYTVALGMSLTCRYPGGSFYGSGGYHHHLATNVWSSRGAGPMTGAEAGLAELVLRADAAERDAIAARTGHSGDRFTLRDPWNIPITIATKELERAGR